ncbi:DUF4832 domain-containing protein [Tannerella sp.]|uniref:DUF4832 domain-containing protein n=1 Tax=Tannerella sp. TaxID=2382127 RepID=UPI0026DB9E82|nr:DUF4832 domain-containing protein [Tannerella sp.]MDO4703285.1 DUF4832 domain-containing protein [Tannerella sp.]
MKKRSFSFIISLFVCLCIDGCGRNDKPDIPEPPAPPDMPVQTVNYVTVNDLFPNPERGFYKYSLGQDQLREKWLHKLRKDNISLMFRFYYLKDFKNKPLDEATLTQIKNDMAIFRKAGFKAILRFGYSNADKEPDAPLAIILRHLDQLRPVLHENKDVIAVMHAGFIGSWGEWYYSTNKLNNDVSRKKVLDKILDILPPDRFVQVRRPSYKRMYVGTQSPISAQEAFGTKAIARIGHHNDCFLASTNDIGTYVIDIAEEKKYMHADALYAPVGGETCPPEGISPADCAKAQSEMRYLRWSFLNQDYYHGVNDQWITQGCMDHIVRNMGYRFTLQKGSYSTEHAPGSELSALITLKNVGYAPPFNPRKVELILRSTDGTRTYTATLPDDPRRWQPDQITELKANVALPSDIPEGSYKLHLFLPDPEPALHDRPEYAIRLANRDCWEETTGYNDLHVEIKVDASTKRPPSRSKITFTHKKTKR